MNDVSRASDLPVLAEVAPLAISARGLVKTFGDVRAVDGIDLDVPRGMIFAILGPNGAGKTTLMRMLATLSRPEAGSATVMGHDLRKAPHEVRAAIAMTGQFASLDEDLTGRENLVLLARLWGFRGRAAKSSRRRAARGFRPVRSGDEAGEGLFRRHAAQARHRRLADRHAGRPLPRRADHRPRPEGPQGCLEDDPRARRLRRHDPAHHAISRRGRSACGAHRRHRSWQEDCRRAPAAN